MLLLDKTMATPEENLALDEALLEQAEANDSNSEILRIWESKKHFVVLGRSSKLEEEVNTGFCREKNIPVLRRASGGASIVTGPGCLMYGLLLSYELRPHLRMLDKAHLLVMHKIQLAFERLGIKIEFQGTCDLTFENRKFSGNSLRCKRDWMLYHGTILYDFDLDLISKCLKSPNRQPEYRKDREHGTFVRNVAVNVGHLKGELSNVWRADSMYELVPLSLTQDLVVNKYSQMSWNLLR